MMHQHFLQVRSSGAQVALLATMPDDSSVHRMWTQHCFHFIDVQVGCLFVAVARLWSWPALEHKAICDERDFLVS